MASLPDDPERKNNYDFLVAQGNVYRQRGQDDRALALSASPTNSTLRTQPSAPRKSNCRRRRPSHHRSHRRGLRRTCESGVEDENIYQLDARLLGVQQTGTLMPPPRRTIETFADSRFQFRPDSFPAIQGFIAERNAQGSFSFPSELSFRIVIRSTQSSIFPWRRFCNWAT